MNDVEKKFERMGARVQIEHGPLRVDVKPDRNGRSVFHLQSDVPLVVLDVNPADKHLVLMARTNDSAKPKFLCGFDERGWFAAPLPESQHTRFRGTSPGRRGISDVESAKMSLKPREVVEAEEKKKVKRKHRLKRSNKASKRQGEWFFLPEPSLVVKNADILKNEPIRMGSKREHRCAELIRTGGEKVYVGGRYPNGITQKEYDGLSIQERNSIHWQVMVRNARVYVRGAISAPDHHTLHLECWHRVLSNTESTSRHADRVAFLD